MWSGGAAFILSIITTFLLSFSVAVNVYLDCSSLSEDFARVEGGGEGEEKRVANETAPLVFNKVAEGQL